jgi:hypothetical protein
MTKREFDQEFKMNDLKIIAEQYESDGIPDKPARREAYNNKADFYCKDGIITDKQYNDFCIPDNLETTLYWL